MTHPLIEGLIALPEATEVTVDSFDALLNDGDDRVTMLFFTGDPTKRLETADVAVVARELLTLYPGMLRLGVVAMAAEGRLMRRAKAVALPSLSFFRGGEHVETIPRIQDWSVYAERMSAILGLPAAAA